MEQHLNAFIAKYKAKQTLYSKMGIEREARKYINKHRLTLTIDQKKEFIRVARAQPFTSS